MGEAIIVICLFKLKLQLTFYPAKHFYRRTFYLLISPWLPSNLLLPPSLRLPPTSSPPRSWRPRPAPGHPLLAAAVAVLPPPLPKLPGSPACRRPCRRSPLARSPQNASSCGDAS